MRERSLRETRLWATRLWEQDASLIRPGFGVAIFRADPDFNPSHAEVDGDNARQGFWERTQ